MELVRSWALTAVKGTGRCSIASGKQDMRIACDKHRLVDAGMGHLGTQLFIQDADLAWIICFPGCEPVLL